ncbi:MAG TPA: hypothetical protein VD993_01610 [Chitinophagaceae bacterium]|nr:hypothetical protein [Chitinophagaceae bacterium]
MKSLLICCMAACWLSCNQAMHVSSAPVVVKGNPMLLGKITVKQLDQPPFSDWYRREYAAYHPDGLVRDSLHALINTYRFEIFLGTWCGDSRREVPRLMKLLDQMGVKQSAVTIVALGNRDTLYKQSPAHEEQGKEIYRVPHLNIYRKGKEIGRITETPVKTWEKDMLAIIRGELYVPKYPPKRLATAQ